MTHSETGIISWLKPIEAGFQSAVDWVFQNIFFYEICGFPIIVLWLITAAVFFTFRLGFINIRLFKHGIKVIAGKYSSPDDPGEVTHFQAFTAAVSATVGLGNIAGVAVVSIVVLFTDFPRRNDKTGGGAEFHRYACFRDVHS